MFDLKMIKAFYDRMPDRMSAAKNIIQRPLTLTEKILFTHLAKDYKILDYERGESYVSFSPDRVAMQDATAQMALLQFMMAGKDKVAVPTTTHCDHLIQAKVGAEKDLEIAKDTNTEVYDFLESVSNLSLIYI